MYGKMGTVAAVCLAALLSQAHAMTIGTNVFPAGYTSWDPTLKHGGVAHYNDMFVDGFANVSGKEPMFRQPWLDDLKKYNGGIRFMDFCNVNNFETQFKDGTWASRRQPTDRDQGLGTAYEYIIKVANLTHQNAWFCVPNLADDDHIRKLATLIYTTLDPDLKCYIEWSNECWNFAFSVTRWAAQKGAEVGLPGDEMRRAFRYSVYAHMHTFKIFEEVFGKDAPTRLVKVQGGWFGHDAVEVQAAAFTDPKCNPDGIKVDAYAIAPYFMGANDDGAVDLVAQATASINVRAADAARCRKVLDAVPATYTKGNKIKLFCYEGGQHYNKNADDAARNPAIYDLFILYFDKLSPYVDEFFHFADQSGWGDWAWGAKEYIGQPDDESPRFRAIMDWMKKHPVSPSRATAPAAGKAALRAGAASARLLVLPVQGARAEEEMYLLNGTAVRRAGQRAGMPPERGVCVTVK